MKNRVSYFDNAKFFLILLVVFGHLIRPLIEENETIMTIYKFVYTFHMPAFILISGYFAKGIKQKGYVHKVAKKLILPYLIFQGIYSVYYFFIENKNRFIIDPLDPHWSLWFLLSLFFWNLLLLGVTKLPKKGALTLAFGLGIGIGYIDDISNYLSLSRTFVFFPLFLIGYYLKLEDFSKITSKHVRISSIVLLTGIFIAYFKMDFDYEWLFGSKPYSHFSEPTLISSFIRLGFYSLTLITSICFLSLIPKNYAFYTEWGTRTFYVYLLHGFIVQAMRNSVFINWLEGVQSISLVAFLAILLTSLLSTKLVQEIAKPLIEVRSFSLLKYRTITKG
ncbi:acyltransferase family protein [Metabacillus sp. HB246100]